MPGARTVVWSAWRRGIGTPASASSCSRGRPPGRRSAGESPDRSTIVDSSPTLLGPPSMIRSTRSPSAARTCAAVVGETDPNRLADGAAIPPPNARRSSRASGCAGTRRPTVSRPPVTASGTRGPRRRMIVSGPGQQASASTCAIGGTSDAQSGRVAAEERWTMRGCAAGRPFASKIRATAAGLEASAPSPYTVSVGNATSPPPRRISTALVISGDWSMRGPYPRSGAGGDPSPVGPRVECRIRVQLPAADGGPDDHRGPDEHEVLDDVLALEGWRERELREGLAGEEHEWGQRAGHLRGEQEQRGPQEAPAQQPEADQALPGRKQRQGERRTDDAQGEQLDRAGRQVLGGTQPRKELQGAEPQEHDPERHPEHGDGRPGEERRESPIEAVEPRPGGDSRGGAAEARGGGGGCGGHGGLTRCEDWERDPPTVQFAAGSGRDGRPPVRHWRLPSMRHAGSAFPPPTPHRCPCPAA